MTQPYRDSGTLPQDPVHLARARLIDEITSGLRVLNEKLQQKGSSAYDYRVAIEALQALYRSVIGGA